MLLYKAINDSHSVTGIWVTAEQSNPFENFGGTVPDVSGIGVVLSTSDVTDGSMSFSVVATSGGESDPARQADNKINVKRNPKEGEMIWSLFRRLDFFIALVVRLGRSTG